MIFLLSTLIAVGLASCNGPTAVSSEVTCAELVEADCIDSTICTLEQPQENGPYSCRDARDDCERGFAQRSGTAEQCEAAEGCTFVPGFCYCEPDMTCVCGGGPPPQCTSAGGGDGVS